MTDETVPTPAAAPAGGTTAPTPAAARPYRSLRFSARDLMNVAIFAVIYFVIVFVVGMIGIISPLVMLFTLPLAPIAAGIPYMLFLTKVRHAGMVALFGTVVALIYLMMGHPWQSTLVTIAVSLIAEAILWAGSYRSTWSAIWAYTAFSAWFIGPWIPMFLDRAAYLRSPGMVAMGPQYIAAFDQVVSPPAVVVAFVAALVCGFLGGLLGTAQLRKHFIRAGLA